MNTFVFLLLVCLAGCVNKPIAGTVTYIDPSAAEKSGALVFPHGNYRHDVQLHIVRAEDGKAKDFAFQGLAQIDAQKIQLVALSPFQTTLMTVVEDRVSGEVKSEFYLEAVRKHQDKFNDYYALIRRVITLEHGGAVQAGVRIVARSTAGEITALKLSHGTGEDDVSLEDYIDHIPRKVRIVDPNFRIDMKVEPLPERAR